MRKYGVVFTTAGKEEEAKKIAKTLVHEKLAACVNIINSIESYYIWENKFVEDKELLLIIKTRISLFEKLKKRIVSLHSYKVPEIILIPIEKGLKSYLSWIEENTQRL